METKASSPKKLNTKMVKKQKMQNQKEESLREILNFFINQVNVRKFLQKMKAVVDSTKQEEKIQDDFLNPNEYMEIKGIYDDYNLGDLIIVFQNPDADGVKNIPITFKEAEKIYDDVLTQKNDDVSESQLKKEKEAFLLSFLTLDDYETEKEKKKRKEQEEKLKKEEEAKLDSDSDEDKSKSDQKSAVRDKSLSDNQQRLKSDPSRKRAGASNYSNNRSELNKAENVAEKIDLSDMELDFDLDKEGQEKDEKEEQPEQQDQQKLKELTSYESYLEFMKKYNEIMKQKRKKEEREERRRTRKMATVITPLDQKKSPLIKQSMAILPKTSQVKFTEEDMSQIPEDAFQMDPMKELFKIKLSDQKQFRKVKKQSSQGGYLTKVKEADKIVGWICTNQPPKDFLTLIRFAVIEKLTRNAFLHCRQFISQNGAQIIVVVKSTKEIIMRQAQKIKVTKQVELGFADLFSLEPVDSKLRPLRLKKYIRSYQSGTEEDQKIQAKLLEDAQTQGEKVAALKPGQTVEDHCKQLYPKVCHWESFELRYNIIKKQQDVDKILKKLVQDLNIDQSQEKSEILNDEELSKEEWQTYYIYLESLYCFGEWISDLKSKGAHEVKDNQAFLYKLVFRKALADSNQFWFNKNKTFWKDITNNRSILLNIWGRLNIDPIAPYTEFFLPSGEAAKSMWRKYEVNEKNLRSEFLNMEKIKLTHALILKHINLLMMLQKQYAQAYIPLHDQYQLNGLPKSLLFQNLQDNEFIKKQEQTQGEKMLKTLFVQLKSQAEPTDYDSISVEKDGAFNIKQPWHIPIQTMRDYFGEKIAIYFLFLTFYTKQLWYLSIVGIIFQGMLSASAPGLQDTLSVIFSVLIIIWSTFFIEYWKQEEVIFSLQYGQQNLEQDSAERPAFKGKFIRSITMDNLNEQFYSPFKRQMTQLFAFGISLLIICMAVGCVLGIMFLKNLWIEQGLDAVFTQTLPGILNSIQINFFTKVYFIVASQFNIMENHKILTTFENSLIVKDFIFRFVNNFNSFFIISFLSGFFPNLNICKVNEIITNDCFKLLSTQLSTIFSSNLTGSLPLLIVPFVKLFAMTQLKNLLEEKQAQYAFDSIDRNIEEQLGLDPYQTNEEVDGSVQDYMLITIQFGYLVLFGVSFPACYLMAFAQNILKIQVDKLKFIKFARRPFPQGAQSIGNWLVLLDIITFIGIFVNAGLIVFTSGFITKNQEVYFPLILVCFLVLKYIIRFIIPSYPQSARILNARHKCIVDKVVKGFSDTSNKQLVKTNLYSKLGGVNYLDDISEYCVDENDFQKEREKLIKFSDEN